MVKAFCGELIDRLCVVIYNTNFLDIKVFFTHLDFTWQSVALCLILFDQLFNTLNFSSSYILCKSQFCMKIARSLLLVKSSPISLFLDKWKTGCLLDCSILLVGDSVLLDLCYSEHIFLNSKTWSLISLKLDIQFIAQPCTWGLQILIEIYGVVKNNGAYNNSNIDSAGLFSRNLKLNNREQFGWYLILFCSMQRFV